MAGPIAVDSHDTALCLIPPRHLWSPVNRLRALYDKSYEKWPPHVNLVYPFVRPENLPLATELLGPVLRRWKQETPTVRVSLDAVDVFTHQHDNTIFRYDSNLDRVARLSALRNAVLEALGCESGARDYRMHMSIGQSGRSDSDAHMFLVNKIGLMSPIAWDVNELTILLRERMHTNYGTSSRMKVWGCIDISSGVVRRLEQPTNFRCVPSAELSGRPSDEDAVMTTGEQRGTQSAGSLVPPFLFDGDKGLWRVVDFLPPNPNMAKMPERLLVSSYNVLGEFQWPPSQVRYPLLVQNILQKRACADILVLQEVTDDFLPYLLRDERVRARYPFTSRGPPDQEDIEPLPSMLNIVILSRLPFDWSWLSFPRRHKGAVVARLREVGRWEGDRFLPVVLAAVHLTRGLTDGAVATKKLEFQELLSHLSRSYPGHPWVIAGDFNTTTSTFTVEAALRKKAVTRQSAEYLETIDRLAADAKLVDAWTVSRFDIGDASDIEPDHWPGGGNEGDGGSVRAEGEQGATYDPLTNEVAASIVGSGFNMRPQRYDRILVRGEHTLAVEHFNKFGFLKGRVGDEHCEPTYASDHWGVRCIMRVGSGAVQSLSDEVTRLVVPVRRRTAAPSLSNPESVKACLEGLSITPTETEFEKRRAVFNLLRSVLLEVPLGSQPAAYHKSRASVVIVPVGSYGLGVWTTSSDIDCLCIGPFSSATFFALATRRLKKAAVEGIRLLRRVRAHTGTMLELEIRSIRVDLQYCPATSIAEHWPQVLLAAPSDPVWSLPAQTLSKLKAARDLDYLRRSIPDFARFCIAHRFIHAWAQSRGIYSARFGYLGGIQISILLARVFKLLVRETAGATSSLVIVTVPDLLATFFNHYASFDWKNKIAFDPFFHRSRLQYFRTAREPLAILDYFPPGLNTSHTASQPSVHTLEEEFRRADALLSTPGMTWMNFLRGATPESVPRPLSATAEFLRAYDSYVDIAVQYWGMSPTRGAQFVGWLEGRCVMLLVDLHRRLPDVHARVWPARFVESEDVTGQEQPVEVNGDRDYQGHYLVGLAGLGDRCTPEGAAGVLESVLRRFEEQIRGDEKYFDTRCCWACASVLGRQDVARIHLVVDDRQWGGWEPGEEEEDDDDDDDDDDDGTQNENPEVSGPDGSDSETEPPPGPSASRKKGKRGKKEIRAAISRPRTAPGKRFRTAADVLNRIRWDPELDSADYVIGYEDRFLGAQEKALDAWKSDQTHEEFIPQHRILYFKRRHDGFVVWERRTRKDELFRSGV
ncbi:hypothetical protein VTK73DRAFT_3427 [Phialemonium thermophilum]|uniref:polynucleotide adenylyltransferase n=1 Tax=Phialemonium thermophilum TaxID=223376 RepID=A0ABR3WZ48_9PEZI